MDQNTTDQNKASRHLTAGRLPPLDERLVEAAADAREAAPPAQLRARLLKEVGQRAAKRERRRNWRGTWFEGWLAAAVAAAVFLLVFLLPRAVRQPQRVSETARLPSASQPAVSEAAQESYVALPYSDPSISNGTETAVAVNLSPSELIAWGIAPPAGQPDAEVPAVLILGSDGLPLAVRVLTSTSLPSAEELLP